MECEPIDLFSVSFHFCSLLVCSVQSAVLPSYSHMIFSLSLVTKGKECAVCSSINRLFVMKIEN